MTSDSQATAAQEKCCTRCSEVKPLAAFHRAKRGKFGVSSICKECAKAKTYAYRRENPGKHAEIQARYRALHIEKCLESCREWAAANPEYERTRYKRRREDPARLATLRANNARIGRDRRAVLAASSGVPESWTAILLSQPCAYCLGRACELEHVVPLSMGGTHDTDNVVPVCRSCNARKNNKSLLAFLLTQRRSAIRRHAHGAH